MEQLSVQSGVPRREPCIKCDKPIFLAERMKIGDRFYHRRCLRCARCRTQLTLGSFYETEVDGEFCCETCPDEEEKSEEDEDDSIEQEMRLGRAAGSGGGDTKLPSLIANRLAMFEKKESELKAQSWRNSSLSDEQKSRTKSMANFMHDQVVEVENAPPPLPDMPPPPQPEVLIEPESSHVEIRRNSEDSSLKVSNIRSMFERKSQLETKSSVDSLKEETSSLDKKNESSIDGLKEKISVKYEKSVTSPIKQIPLGRNSEKSLDSSTKPIPLERNAEKSVDSLKLDISIERQSEKSTDSLIKEISLESKAKMSEDSSKLNVSIERIREVSVDPSKKKSIFETESEKSLNSTIKHIPMEIMLGNSSKEGKLVQNTYKPSVDTPKEELFQESKTQNTVTKNPEESKPQVESQLRLTETSPEKQPSLENPAVQEVKTEETVKPHPITTTNTTAIKSDNLEAQPLEAQAALSLDNDNVLELSVAVREESKQIESTKESDTIKKSIEKKIELEGSGQSITKLSQDEKVNEKEDKKQYPSSLNPFGSDDDDDEEEVKTKKAKSMNPFDSEDDEVELDKVDRQQKKVSTNPFGSESEEEEELQAKIRTPVPTPRKTVMTLKPEPSPRFQMRLTGDDNGGSNKHYGSLSSLGRNTEFRGSTNSLSSCSSANTTGTYRVKKKRRAPLPPTERTEDSASYLSPNRKTSNASGGSQDSSMVSNSASPKLRKKRPAPAPPVVVQPPDETLDSTVENPEFNVTESKISEINEQDSQRDDTETFKMRVIPIDIRLLEDKEMQSLEGTMTEFEKSDFVRRKIVPLAMEEEDDEEDEADDMESSTSSRQWEKLKDNKESANRNRQSLISNSSNDGQNGDLDRFYNKSSHGKWKRRKGPAPSLPVPPKRVLEMLPVQEIKHELEVIEVQQQGLEKQGVQLEKMIREKCEGEGAEDRVLDQSSLSSTNKNTKEVEDLIMQLFDLVVEKNELFRRQAELMYLRRQNRLEQEQADLEYEIRVLMAQPECNRTDSDKAREEAMIARLVEVVKQRNEVVDSLEMDRLREAQEDLGIKQETEKHLAKWDDELKNQKPTKLSKKEKKAIKEAKKLKNKKQDVDKDDDETEAVNQSSENGGTLKEEKKKKKKKFLII